MKVERGASQILFGMLPGQTVDLEGRIWKVARWLDPVPIPLDQNAVREALLAAIAPWAATSMDDGLDRELRSRTGVKVVGINMQRGVLVDPFPNIGAARAAAPSPEDGMRDAPAVDNRSPKCSS